MTLKTLGKRGNVPGKENLRVTCPTGKVEFKYFSSPDKYVLVLTNTSDDMLEENYQESLGKPHYSLMAAFKINTTAVITYLTIIVFKLILSCPVLKI